MSITITVTRDSSATGGARLGTFSAGSVRGVTLENESLKIPTGSYSASIYKSPKFKRNVILLSGISGRSMIEIHNGNYVGDTTGCILVGTKANKPRSGDGSIDTSVPKLTALVSACQGKSITVVVK